MKTARIIGTGSYLPKTILTNSDLYKNPKIIENFDIEKAKQSFSRGDVNISKLNDSQIFKKWVMRMTGINQRYIYTDDFDSQPDFIGPVENMGAEAAKRALKASKISPKDLDFIIAATFTQAQSAPDPSCSIGHLIGAKGVPGTHTNNACAGFVYGMIQAQKEIQTGAKKVLVVASERLSKITNYQDPKTAALFADGAGAVVLTADKTGILSFSRASKYEGEHIRLSNKNKPGYQNMVEMSGGPKVLANAVKAMSKQTKMALEKANLTLDDIKYIIPHQANGRITTNLAKSLDIPLERICSTIKNIGNTSNSSVAIALDKLVRGELPGYHLEKKDKMVLTAVGVGYAMAALVAEF